MSLTAFIIDSIRCSISYAFLSSVDNSIWGCSVFETGFSLNISCNFSPCFNPVIVIPISPSGLDSDLIVIATPLSSYENVILKIKDSLKDGAILTDVGSVKENIINLIEKNIPKNVSWIPSHPIAGTEESGPESGFSKLFENRWCILTPSKNAKQKEINLIKSFWENVGSKVDIMEAEQHDYILSITSHIPHLIAYNIVNTTINIQDKKNSNVVKYSAGGLRDFTRIAASNPIMWRDIFIQNKKRYYRSRARCKKTWLW